MKLLAVLFAQALFWALMFPSIVLAQTTTPADPNQALSTRELWSAVVGIAMPLLIAVPMQPGWPKWWRAVFGALCCIVAAAVTSYLDGSLALSGSDAIFRSILLVLLAAWSSYNGLWAHTLAPKIEHGVMNIVGPRPPA